MHFNKGILAVFILIMLSSCKMRNTYEFRIVNETDYTIDRFAFDDKEFTLSPNDSSEIFSERLVYNCLCFSEPLVSIGVRRFSDTTGTYDHDIGQVFAPRRRSTSGTNIFRITLKDSVIFPDRVFRITYMP